MRTFWLVTLTAALALGLWASCGGDDGNGTPDSGDTSADGTSCSRTDECRQGERCLDNACSGILPTLTETGADMSCVGSNPPITPTGTDVSTSIYVEDFEDDYRVEGAMIDLFLDNVVDDTPDRTVGPSDSNGVIAAADVGPLPGLGMIAYRIHGDTLPDGEVRTTIEYDLEIPETDGGEVRALSVSDNTYRLIQTILGITPDASHGVIAGEFQDCAASPQSVEGVVVRMLNASGQDCHELNQRECYSRYFQDDFPARIDHQPHSSPDGLYGLVQVPPGDWTLQILGRLTDATTEYPYDLLGQKVVRATANAIVVVDVGPLAEPVP